MFIGIERKSLTKDTVTYVYYPKDDKSIEPGEITINIHTSEVLEYKKSGEERRGFDNYFVHAMGFVFDTVKNNHFPERKFIAWG